MRHVAVLLAFAALACGQTNGDPTPPTVVTAPTTTSTTPPPSASDAGNDAEADAGCAGYADPTADAGCHAKCTSGPCNANGCFGAYYCDLGALKCVPKPASCP